MGVIKLLQVSTQWERYYFWCCNLQPLWESNPSTRQLVALSYRETMLASIHRKWYIHQKCVSQNEVQTSLSDNVCFPLTLNFFNFTDFFYDVAPDTCNNVIVAPSMEWLFNLWLRTLSKGKPSAQQQQWSPAGNNTCMFYFLPVLHQVNLLRKAVKLSPALKRFPLSIFSVQPFKKI